MKKKLYGVYFILSKLGKRQHVMTSSNKEVILKKLKTVYPNEKIVVFHIAPIMGRS